MCGIIGVIGEADPVEVLLRGLESLEYRGYDSAGVAIVDRDAAKLWCLRAAVPDSGSIAKLEAGRDKAPSGGAAAIGHTRWATHGPPTELNAHPHRDCAKRVAVVHNGIIENHRELSAKLAAGGHELTSETDTEVVAHLLEDELGRGADLFESMRRCVSQMRGDFAIAAVTATEPDVIVAARRSAPLLIGRTPTSGLVASDLAALLGSTREVYPLGDDQIAEVGPGSFRVVDVNGVPVELEQLEVSWDLERAQKSGFPDYMSKEIFEQPGAVADTLLGRVHLDGSTEIEELVISDEQFAGIERVFLVACGSSYHAALVGRHAMEHLAGIPAEVDIASEFRYRDLHLGPKTLVVAVSQSGETADTLHAMKAARQHGAVAIAMTNVVGSLMAREADGVCYTRAGPEIGVASTKCHLAQVTLLEVLALHLARVRGELSTAERAAWASQLLGLPSLIEACLERRGEYEEIARRFATTENFYFLGRRLGFPIALEGALKLKELAYVRAEAYPAGEMKHGPISLIEPGAVVVAVATRTDLWEKVMLNIEEMKARGATVIALAEEGDAETARAVDAVLVVPPVPEILAPIVDVVPLQWFAYEIAVQRGNDVDRPRNLAKVVTVE